jgi:hypothetical protein
MKIINVKALSAAIALSGLLNTSTYGNTEGNLQASVDGELAPPGAETLSNEASPGKGGVLVCEDLNQDGFITFEECTFTEN